jgi:hypothetical protein
MRSFAHPKSEPFDSLDRSSGFEYVVQLGGKSPRAAHVTGVVAGEFDHLDSQPSGESLGTEANGCWRSPPCAAPCY